MPLPFSALWTIGLIAAVVYGISIGSFLNVVIYRLPRGQSVASPTWSYCPNCQHRLAAADLIPLGSFLALGRKCRYCRTPISWRYFGVEGLTGLLFTLVYLRDGFSVGCVFDALFVALLVPIFFIDLEQFYIPDELSVLGFAVGVAHNLYGIWQHRPGMWVHPHGWPIDIAGSIASGIICALLFHLISFFGLLFYARGSKLGLGASVGRFWAGVGDDYAYLALKFLGFGLWLPAARRFIETREAAESAETAAGEADDSQQLRSREEIASELESDEEQTGMGQGDAKLALMIGANLLLPMSLLSFFIAVLTGTIVGVGVMLRQGRGGRTAIPFGPFMSVGAVVALLIGPQLLAWYMRYAFPAHH